MQAISLGGSQIRVLFYEPYPMGLGGNYRTQRLILERLDRSLYQPIVLSPIEGVALDDYRQLNVQCHVIAPGAQLGQYGGALLRGGFFSKLRAVVSLIRYNIRLARFLREEQIDVVYANCVRAEMSIGLAARLTNTPSLLYIKGQLNNRMVASVSFALAHRILFFCKTNREDVYPHLIRRHGHKMGILKIGLDPATTAAVQNRENALLRRELAIDSSYSNAIVLAQLYPPKGQHFVLEVLARLVEDFPKIRLYLLGDHVIDEYSPYKEKLEAIVERHQLHDHVRFCGWRRDALDVTSMMDIVIHPSLAEGFGRAVLESMALGKPVIASKVGGLREAIRNGQNGFLVEPGDVDSIEIRWRELLVDPELRLRLGQAAQETVLAEYQIDDKVMRIAEIWSEMAGGGI